MNTPKAIIFDLDGVLTDTSEYHYQAWKHLADDEGIPFTHEENDAHLRGVGRRDSLLYLLKGRTVSEAQMQEMMDRKNRYYAELIKNMSPWRFRPLERDTAGRHQNGHCLCQQEHDDRVAVAGPRFLL